MENALLVGLSRQMALTHDIDIVANNIANID
ncbi:MAG: flagellar basal body protein, partial [Xanthobacteraceae bacterium]